MKYDLVARALTKEMVIQLTKPLFVRGNDAVGYDVYAVCVDDLSTTHNHMDFITGEIKPLEEFIQQCQRSRR